MNTTIIFNIISFRKKKEKKKKGFICAINVTCNNRNIF